MDKLAQEITFINDKAEDIDHSQRKGFCGFFRHLLKTYDKKVLAMIMINGFNRGGRSVAVFSLILIFKSLGVGPNVRQTMFATIYSAQLLSFPMGLITETLPIFGSRNKSYLFLASIF